MGKVKSSGFSLYIGKRVGAKVRIEACRGVDEEKGVDKMRWIVEYRAPFAVCDRAYGMGNTKEELPILLKVVEKYIREFKEDYKEFEYRDYIEKLDIDEIKNEIINRLNNFEDGIVNLLIYATEVPYLSRSK